MDLIKHMFSDRRPPWVRNLVKWSLQVDWLSQQLFTKCVRKGSLNNPDDVARVRRLNHLYWLFENEIAMAYKEGFCHGPTS